MVFPWFFHSFWRCFRPFRVRFAPGRAPPGALPRRRGLGRPGFAGAGAAQGPRAAAKGPSTPFGFGAGVVPKIQVVPPKEGKASESSARFLKLVLRLLFTCFSLVFPFHFSKRLFFSLVFFILSLSFSSSSLKNSSPKALDCSGRISACWAEKSLNEAQAAEICSAALPQLGFKLQVWCPTCKGHCEDHVRCRQRAEQVRGPRAVAVPHGGAPRRCLASCLACLVSQGLRAPMARRLALGVLALLAQPWGPRSSGPALVPLLNRTRADRVGSARLVAYDDGRLQFEVFGFGTLEATERLLADCEEALQSLERCSVLVDMRHGVGCSPLAVPSIVAFVRRHRQQLQHVAVLGPRPLMALARAICRATQLSGVGFFSDRKEAEDWCALE